jgi:hypothetical protein
MADLPTKCLVDTNVPITANRAARPDLIPAERLSCVWACVEAIEHVTRTRGLILDAGDEIFDEYRRHLSLQGQPGVGDIFMKWVHDHRWILHDSQRVGITRRGDTYDEFPLHDGLTAFDKADRKFVAVANAHADKPPILQATDSKWLEWKGALAEAGITVLFLCPEYVKTKHAGKKKK